MQRDLVVADACSAADGPRLRLADAALRLAQLSCRLGSDGPGAGGQRRCQLAGLLADDRFWQDVLQTGRFALVSVTAELFLALLIALLLISAGEVAVPYELHASALGFAHHDDGSGLALDLQHSLWTSGSSDRELRLGPLNLMASPQWTWLATVVADVWKTTAVHHSDPSRRPADDSRRSVRGLPSGRRPLYAGPSGDHPALLLPYILLSCCSGWLRPSEVFDLIQVLTGGGPAGSTEPGVVCLLERHAFPRLRLQRNVMLGGFVLLSLSILLGALALRLSGALRPLQS